MRPFFAIVRLTVRNAVRSHIFQLLLGLLAVCVAFIPSTISGDGTAEGFIQISLLYSLSSVMLVLTLSSVWLSCSAMTQDIDSYQLHMVISKPVSRITVWLGKYCGILFINTLLLFISATAIYFIVQWNFARQEFTPEERAKIANEVMVGRRVFYPDRPDLDAMSREVLKEKLKALEAQGKDVDTSPEKQKQMLADTRREIIARASELAPGGSMQWVFSNLPADNKQPLYLRYRNYIGKISSEGQRLTHGMWFVGKAQPAKAANGEANVFSKDKAAYQLYAIPLSQTPEQIKSGVFHEKEFPAEWELVTPDGKLVCMYTNMDTQNSTLYFQVADGPKILLKVTGFAANYFRAVFVIFLELAILTGLGCAAAGVLTMPMAIYVVISYLLFGAFATYMTGNTYMNGAMDYMGYYLSKVLLLVVIPLQKFEITGLVAHGELIEFSFIWNLILSYVILRAVPFFIIGILLYRRREMGLVIRK